MLCACVMCVCQMKRMTFANTITSRTKNIYIRIKNVFKIIPVSVSFMHQWMHGD